MHLSQSLRLNNIEKKPNAYESQKMLTRPEVKFYKNRHDGQFLG